MGPISAQAESPADIFRRGQAALRTGKAQQALDLCGAVADADPEAWRARLCVADALLALERPAEAEQEVRMVVERHPDAAAAWSWLGGRAWAREQWTLAAERYGRSTRLRDGEAKAATAVRWGVALLRSDDLPAAQTALEVALEADPASAHAWLNAGVLANRQKRYEAARRAFERATRLAPGMGNAWFNLGRAYRRQGWDRAALAAFEEAITLAAEDVELRLAAAEQLLRLQRYAEAEEQLEAARAQAPSGPLLKRLEALSERARR
ncbi:MAG: tetratricopeptide repeat protein [Myxococcota bacterium]